MPSRLLLKRTVAAVLLIALDPFAAFGQTSTPARQVRTTRATSRISIDGVLSEPVWNTAEACTAFVQRDPVEGATPSQRTDVRVVYDEDAIYFGARLYDTSPDSIVTELSRRDGGTRSDRFVAYLDPYLDRRSGYFFGINAAGTLFDGTLYNDGWSDNSWDAVWEGKTRRDAEGWTVEMRVPFSQLRFAQSDQQQWGINFMRQMGRGFEDIYFENRPKKESGFVSLFPTLVGLENVNPTNAIEITPYATSKVAFVASDPSDPFNDGSTTQPSMGGDLRMPVGGQLTLSATANPDFGQVEVDPAVVNLSDVETFFPEKRPFFVEGSSIYSAGQQGASDYWGFNYPQPTFFYSRRIGHKPEGSLPDYEYADVPLGTTILGAAKLSGKLAPGLNFGMMHALTAKENAEFQRSDLTQSESMVEPLTYYGVGRVLKEFDGRRRGLGNLTTLAYRDIDDSPIENEFNEAAVTSVVDGWHFLDGRKAWVLSGWAGGSFITGTTARMQSIQTNSRHYFQRPDAKSYSLDPNATSLVGSGARVWLNKEKGNWLHNSAIGYLSPGFEANDLGFQSRADVVNGHATIGYKWTDPTKHVKNRNLVGAVFGSTNFDGDVTSAGVWGKGFWWFTNNWTLETVLAYNPETVNPRRSRGGPLMLNSPGVELGLFGDTDGSRKRYYYLSYNQYDQPEEGSYNRSIYPFFVYKPASNIRFELGPGYETVKDAAFYVSTIADPTATATYGNRYVFANLQQKTLSANIRFNVSFTPTMSLQFYGQPLISTGKYTNYRELARPKSLDFVGPGAGAWTWDPATGEFDADGPGGAEPEVHDFNSKSLRGNAVFRWEYMPGSSFYLVWTQNRSHYDTLSEAGVGPSFESLWDSEADDIFLAKVTYYLTR